MMMIRTRPVFAFFLAFALLAAQSGAFASQATELLLNKARSLEGRGLVDLAARSWEQVLLADPANSEALAGLARYSKMNGKKAEADRYLERLRSADPQNPVITRIDGMRSLDQQRGSLNEAQRLAQKQDFDGAMHIYRQVFGTEPPPGNWAISYYETEAATAGGWEDATASLQRLANKYPGSPEYALALGRLLTYRPKTRLQGIQLLESVKGDAAALSKARAAWRQALVWDAANPASLPSLRAYLSRYPDSELAKLLNGKDKSSGAESAQQSVENTREGQAYQALSAGKLKQAEQDFSAVLKASPRDVKALSGLGYVRMKEQNFAEAASLFEEALTAQPRNKSLASALETARFWNHMNRGTDHLNSSRTAEAAEEFKEALAIRPQNMEAARALAGSYEKNQQPSLAVPLYLSITQSRAAKADDWFALVRSQFNAGESQSALKTLSEIPSRLQDSWMADPEKLSLLAFVHADGGDIPGAQSLGVKAQQLLSQRAAPLSIDAQIQLAGLYSRLQQPAEAASVYENIVRVQPESNAAWAGLINSLVQAGKIDRAETVLQQIPSDAYDKALKSSDFLRSVASLETARNRYDRAEAYLQKAIDLEAAAGKKRDPASELQLAQIWSQTGKGAEAERILHRAIEQNSSNAAVWMSYLSLLHAQNRDRTAFESLESLPEKMYLSLRDDPAFIALEAGVYSNLGRYSEALQKVRSAAARFDLDRKPVPVALRLQEAWILLNGQGSDRELYALLSRYTGSPDLSPAEKKDFDSIWSIWSQKRAASASDRGDFAGAVKILTSAIKLFPNDSHMRGTLAGIYLQAGDPQTAFQIYKNWGLKDGSPDDFSGAVGSAFTAHDKDLAQRWLARGLQKYPRDSRLLSLAGKQAAQQGDYERAKIYLREALASMSVADDRAARAEASVAPDDGAKARRSLGALLVGSGVEDSSTQTASTLQTSDSTLLARQSPPAGADSFVTPLNDIDVNALAESTQQRTSDSGSPLTKAPGSMALVAPSKGQPTLEEQINGDLAAITARNSPFFTTGTTIQGRTGQGGVDKLMTQEADFEASTTIGDRLRLSLIAKPTYLDSGSPASTNTLGFGSSTGSATSGTRTAFGIGAEGQIATHDFGMRIGLAPNDFLVHNWIGGLRLNPGHGPFTILLNRDSIRDTKLSFAGERDPASGQVWGGVIANSASVMGNWGDDKSGFYVNAGYQDIRGKAVASNTRLDATMGGYFKVLTTKEGSLTAGLNFSGMHYDKNLRYFTLGQGGYFSPQQYFLANIPVRWTGTWNRVLQYSIAGSLGLQHFTESASPYFPLTDRSGAKGSYAAMASTGGNYNFDFRLGYQLAPQWIAGAFANVGNSRDYRNASAGIFLRYLFQPRPFGSEIAADSIPDWKGAQPFGLPLN